jgi:non-canonical (house-cleaning) NTP pyrophosphatase
MKILVITEGTNETKIEAVKKALATFPEKPELWAVTPSKPVDIRPIDNSERIIGAQLKAAGLLFDCLQKEIRQYGHVASLGIQKGVNVFDEHETLALICTVSVATANGAFSVTVHSDPVLLSEEIRTLVWDGMDIYDAYKKLFGENFESVYEHVTGKKEVDWIAETIRKALAAFFSFLQH